MARCDYSPGEVVGGAVPEAQTIRDQAILAGGVDPMFLRFRLVEREQQTGEVLGIQAHNIGLREAVEMTKSLLLDGRDSHFCLEPVGFLQ